MVSWTKNNGTIDAETVISELSPATLYLLFMVVIFILTALLHGSEFTNLVHGIWYWLCLPSGNLLLIIYSVANLTDRSWGTREGKTQTTESTGVGWSENFLKYLKYICWCCVPPHLRQETPENHDRGVNDDEGKEASVEKETSSDDPQNFMADSIVGNNEEITKDESTGQEEQEREKDEEEGEEGNRIGGEKEVAVLVDTLVDIEQQAASQEAVFSRAGRQPLKSSLKKSQRSFSLTSSIGRKRLSSPRSSSSTSSFRFPGQRRQVKFIVPPRNYSAVSVEDWLEALPEQYKEYTLNFKEHGYDDVSFIAGFIKEKDLVDIGIENRGHRKRLMAEVERLPVEEFFQEVPDNVEEWLMKHGLNEYWPRFEENSYTEPRDLADIKYMSSDVITKMFNIEKKAHLRKLKEATAVLQYPTKAQRLIRDARKAVMSEPTKNMKTDNGDDGAENEFWEEIRNICLLPEQAAFNQSLELQEKLSDMRDTCLLVLTVANVLWLTIMVTVMTQTSLNVLGTNAASLIFLILYTAVLLFQFLALLWHRLETLVHFIARAPFKPGHLKSNWSFRDKDLPPLPKPELLDEIRARQTRLFDRQNSNQSNCSSHDYDDNSEEEMHFRNMTEPLVGRSRRRTGEGNNIAR